jgi:hypothetical protein
MAFRDFTYPEVLRTLHLRQDNSPNLFAGAPDGKASPGLRAALEANVPLATTIHTEMARAMWMVGPVLSEFWWGYRGKISLHAGVQFDADPDAGLSGYCDFLIGKAPMLPQIVAPVIVVVEAKRDDIETGLGQCIAGMVGALRFNRREGNAIDTIYGISTTGSAWKFLKLNGAIVTYDLEEYAIAQVDRLLGILTYIIGPVPGVAAA